MKNHWGYFPVDPLVKIQKLLGKENRKEYNKLLMTLAKLSKTPDLQSWSLERKRAISSSEGRYRGYCWHD